MKICYICKENLEDSNFYRCSKSKDNLGHYCKKCHSDKKKQLLRTKDGLIRNIYYHQVRSSKKRGHNAPLYTLDELKKWVLESSIFEELYNDWVKSDYNKYKSPSIDRLDDFKGYSFDNIRLVSWYENDKKGHSDRAMGIGTQGKANCKEVHQYSLDGIYIASYFSAMEAERQTGVSAKHIPSVCLGKRRQTGGFIWKH